MRLGANGRSCPIGELSGGNGRYVARYGHNGRLQGDVDTYNGRLQLDMG